MSRSAAASSDAAAELPPAAELLAQALQNNPDLIVARAKLAEAEAELHRLQLHVARQMFTRRSEVEDKRARVAQLRKLRESGTVQEREYTAEMTELAGLEADLQFLLGLPPQGAGNHPEVLSRGPVFRAGSFVRGFAFPGEGTAGAADEPPPALPEEKTSATMRTALAKAYRVQFSGSLAKLVEYLNDGRGIRFVLDRQRLAGGGVELDMDMGELKPGGNIPLDGLLQLIEDLHPQIRFVIRDYGILVTARDDMPPGSVTVRDFLKPAGNSF